MGDNPLDRRTFLGSLGRLSLGGLVLRGSDASAASLALSAASGAATTSSKAYGSGYFGEWIEDQFGLPAYHYTCNQTTDPKAITHTDKAWRSPTDQSHQVGNDRLIAVVSNYGYVQVRQDEGSPKFLNDYSPKRSQYGGGLGFLTDGNESLSTFYPGNAKTFDRVFGMGYLRKKVASASYTADHVIFSPFGNDPLLISQVTITNHAQEPADLRWVEYWGCQLYQFSYRSTMEARIIEKAADKAAELRRMLGDRFAHRFRKLEGDSGLLETKRFLGRSVEDERLWQEVLSQLATHRNDWFIEPLNGMPPEVTMEDLNPPPTFLVSLDAPADGFATDGKAFFGISGVGHPAGLAEGLNGDLSSTGPQSVLLLERRLRLGPGESRTLYYAYGYLPDGFEVDSLVKKYRKTVRTLWEDSSRQWKADGMRFRVDSEPWVEREITWDHYYLRSNLTYDSFIEEHVENQNGVYEYIMGAECAAEDRLQHTLPFVFSHPWIVKTVLRYTLKTLQPDGRVAYGIVGHGTLQPTRQLNSSYESWVLWLTSEYVLGTRDKAFLDEVIPTYPLYPSYSPYYGPTAGKDTVRNLVARCYRHLVENTGTGEHGLVRLLNCDWDDGLHIWHRRMPMYRFGEVVPSAESVLDTAQACYCLDHYARMLRYVGDEELAADAHRRADGFRQAVRAQWTGRWFRRAWMAKAGWWGDKHMLLNPQAWAIVGGAATPEQTRVLVSNINEFLRRPSPIGAMGAAAGASQSANLGAVWSSLTSILVWALALVNEEMAWDEWKKNSLARHAEVYPDLWYGIWSGSDNYGSAVSNDPGRTGPDWPVMNMHAHCNQMYSAAKLLGVEFTEKGLLLAPTLPLETYSFDSPLVGVKKSGRHYEGWYSPSVAGTWTVSIRLPSAEAQRLRHVEVNGSKRALSRTVNGAVEFEGESGPSGPLRWSL